MSYGLLEIQIQEEAQLYKNTNYAVQTRSVERIVIDVKVSMFFKLLTKNGQHVTCNSKSYLQNSTTLLKKSEQIVHRIPNSFQNLLLVWGLSSQNHW